MRCFVLICLMSSVAAPIVVATALDDQQRTDDIGRAIVRVAGDVYRVQAGPEATVFVAGSNGILIADPLDLETARWVKTELDSRFPDRPVLFMVEASPSLTRIGGGAAFKPSAQTIGHDGLTRELLRGLRGPPAVMKFVSYPQQTFTTGKTLTLGGKTIRIINSGDRYRPDASMLLFVEDRVLFTWSRRIGAAPFSFSGGNPREDLELVDTIAALQFDTLITSNGQTLERGEFDRLVQYLAYLRSEIATGIKSGRSVNQMVARQVPAAFRTDRHAVDRGTQLSAMYGAARVKWTDVQGSGIYSWFGENSSYCKSYRRCESGAQVIGGTAGLRIGNRRFGAIAEATMTQQFLSVRDNGVIAEVFAHRQTRGSLLVSLGGTRLRGASFNLLAGASLTVGDSDGSRRRDGLAPIGGRRAIAERAAALGLTVGTDLVLPMGNRVSLVLPVRATISEPPQDLWPGKFDANGGIGLRFNVGRRVR